MFGLNAARSGAIGVPGMADATRCRKVRGRMFRFRQSRLPRAGVASRDTASRRRPPGRNSRLQNVTNRTLPTAMIALENRFPSVPWVF